MSDYQKLVSCTLDVLKVFVLVLDTRGEPDNLGKLLLAVEFERPGVVIFENRVGGILCKAWKVGT